jgi:hypothetical protein
VFAAAFPLNISSMKDTCMLQFLIEEKLSGVYSNIFILQQRIMTFSVTMASTEKSIKRLNLIKDYSEEQ